MCCPEAGCAAEITVEVMALSRHEGGRAIDAWGCHHIEEASPWGWLWEAVNEMVDEATDEARP